jgi:hypothetical protein
LTKAIVNASPAATEVVELTTIVWKRLSTFEISPVVAVEVAFGV